MTVWSRQGHRIRLTGRCRRDEKIREHTTAGGERERLSHSHATAVYKLGDARCMTEMG